MDQFAKQPVRRLEYFANLDADAGQGIHVEESSVIDLVQRGPPIREAIRLHFEKTVQVVEALGASGFAVEALDGFVDAPPDRLRLRRQPGETAARHFLLAMTFRCAPAIGFGVGGDVLEGRDDAQELVELRMVGTEIRSERLDGGTVHLR